MIKELIFDVVEEAIKKAYDEDKMGQLQGTDVLNILIVEKTKNPEFGDYSVNVSFLAKHARMSPAQIAEAIKPYLNIDDVEVSIIQGFINFKLGKSVLIKILAGIILESLKKYFLNMFPLTLQDLFI